MAALREKNAVRIANMYKRFEFLIRFSNFDRTDLAKCLDRLPRKPDGRSVKPHFEMRLETDGIYFHDLKRSDFSAGMLRLVLELAAEHSEVQVEGFGSGGFLTPDQFENHGFAKFGSAYLRYRQGLPGVMEADGTN